MSQLAVQLDVLLLDWDLDCFRGAADAADHEGTGTTKLLGHVGVRQLAVGNGGQWCALDENLGPS